MATDEEKLILTAKEARDALRLDPTFDEEELIDYVRRATAELNAVCDHDWAGDDPVDEEAKTACRIIVINDFYRGNKDYDFRDDIVRWKNRLKAKARRLRKEAA